MKTINGFLQKLWDAISDPRLRKPLMILTPCLALILAILLWAALPAPPAVAGTGPTKAKLTLMVYMTGGDCTNGICEDYADEELHPIDEIEEPPYHPNCMCEVCEFELQDLINKE